MSNDVTPLPPLTPVSLQLLAQPCGGLAVQPCLAPVPEAITPSIPPPLSALDKAPAASPSPRCSTKACVFPALSPELRACRYHLLLQSEGELFQSHQPTLLLSMYAPFGIPEEEPDDSRQQDRQRWTAEREAFVLDQPAEVEG